MIIKEWNYASVLSLFHSIYLFVYMFSDTIRKIFKASRVIWSQKLCTFYIYVPCSNNQKAKSFNDKNQDLNTEKI